MAATASPVAPVPVKGGVAPLRAGQGYSFWLRRLHSLTGIIPVGAFLFEHILISNASAIGGPIAYARQVRFLASLPLVPILELFGIWLPILFHALYGFYIWYRGETNVGEYPWTGNWMYTAQRWTGAIAFAYILWHTWTMRFTGIDLHEFPGASFGKVQGEVFSDAAVLVLRRRTDCSVVALRLRHLVILREVGHRFGREGSQAVPDFVFGIFLCADRRRSGEPDLIPDACPATNRSCGRKHG